MSLVAWILYFFFKTGETGLVIFSARLCSKNPGEWTHDFVCQFFQESGLDYLFPLASVH